MSNIARPGMRFASRQPPSSSAASVRNLNPESTGHCRRSHEGNDRTTTIPRRRTTGNGQPGNSDSAGPRQRPECNRILLVHGLQHLSVNCDHIFNLFCLYGNVMTIKILKDKKVLVELDTVEAAKRCVANLHLLPLDDRHNRLSVKYSKHLFIYDQVKLRKLPDGTPTLKVYSTSRLNRFPSAGNHWETRRPAAPSKILHFYNAPTDVCGMEIHKAVSTAIGSTDGIRSVVILPKKRGAMCSTGLVELKSIDLAAKAISFINHMAFESTKAACCKNDLPGQCSGKTLLRWMESRFPFLIKVCFSKWSEINGKNSQAILLGATPRREPPWYLHGSEHGGVCAWKFPVSQTTRVTCDNRSWILWILGDDGDAAQNAAAAAAVPTAGQRHADVADALTTGPSPPTGASDDRGDAAVLQSGLVPVVGEHERDAAVQAVQRGGPLGDA